MVRIGLICNALGASYTIEALRTQEALAGVAVPAANDGVRGVLGPALEEAGVPLAPIKRHNLEEELLAWVASINPDALFVLTFPHLLPGNVLDAPPLGCYNFHPGLLPGYRGPDPTFWELKNREPEGALTIHRMTEAFDDGGIIATYPAPIRPDDTWGMHMADLFDLAPDAALDLAARLTEAYEPIAGAQQEASEAGFFKMPSVSQRTIDWDACDAAGIAALIRACNPMYDGALTIFRGAMVRILDAQVVKLPHSPRLKPGTVVMANADYLVLLCKDGRGLKLNVVATDEGFFGGSHFGERFAVKIGECFRETVLLEEAV